MPVDDMLDSNLSKVQGSRSTIATSLLFRLQRSPLVCVVATFREHAYSLRAR